MKRFWSYKYSIGAILGASILTHALVNADVVSHSPRRGAAQDASGIRGLGLHNRVILQIDDEHILTLMDVVHRMNLIFYTSYPDHIGSTEARYQFYQANFPMLLEGVIDEFLMEADARSKKITVDATTVKEEIEELLGEKVLDMCARFDMSYEDIFRVVERMLLSQKMSGMMVRSKVMLQVTPQQIKDYYAKLVEEAQRTYTWKYCVLTVKSSLTMGAQIAERITERVLEMRSFDKDRVQAFATSLGGSVSISEEYVRTDRELSRSHRKVLENVLYTGGVSCSSPQVHSSGDWKIFVLLDKVAMQVEPLASLENRIKGALLQDKLIAVDKQYKEQLRQRFGYDEVVIAQLLSKEEPSLFSLL